MEVKISVFTPTFNRAATLPLVYDSLKNQVFTYFEWIIIDDGSNDNTSELVALWKDSAPFPIKYFYQSNSGKHIAQNRAVIEAVGELFLPLDSDDTIVPEALMVLWDTWEGIAEDERPNYSGVGVHCLDENGRIIGDLWPYDQIDSNDLEMTFHYKVKGEKWGPIRTDIMRQFPNQVVKGHYLSESTVWYRIATKYKKIYINKALRIYCIQDDSVQKKKSFTDYQNAESKMLSSLIYINEFWNWYKKYQKSMMCLLPLMATKAAVECNRPLLLGKNSLISATKPILAKVFVLMGSPYKVVHCFLPQ